MPDLGTNAALGMETWASYILDRLRLTSALLRAGARFIPIDGREAHIPRMGLDAVADWVDEGAEFPTDAPEADTLDLFPKKCGLVCNLSNESIDDAPVEELDIVGMSLARSVARAIDDRALSTGTASSRLPAGLLPQIPLGEGAISLDNITKAQGDVEAAGGVANGILINPSDLTDLRLLKESATSAVPLLEPDPQAPGAVMYGGSRFVPTPSLPVGTAVVGDMAQIVVGVRRDLVVEFSGHQKFSADSTVARVKARVDFGINDANGLRQLHA